MANAHFIRKFYCIYAKTVAPKNYIMRKICHTFTISTACLLYPLLQGLLYILIHNSSVINTDMLCCIVKLPDEVCVHHTKPVGDSKTVLQLKQFAEVLLTGLTFKNLKKKLVTVNFDVVSVCETNYCLILINHSHSFKGLMT